MKRNRDSDEVSYWQSMADGIVALLLIILLVLMLLMLYLMRAKEDMNLDIAMGNTYNEYNAPAGVDLGKYDDENENKSDNEYEDPNVENSSGGGGGGGGGGGDDGDNDEEFEEEHLEDFPEEGSDLAAVFVQLMDEETQRTIKIEDIQFELYAGNTLQTLCTYYPVKTEYKKFKTDKNGCFYLPEKIPLKSYQLHELSTIDGYDVVYYTKFEVDEAYEWADPYVVNVYLSPSKNTIQIELKDLNDGKPLNSGKFQIIAAQDIVTKDGTTRYKRDAVVDTVSIGSDGIGESKSLYLGRYIIRHVEAQQYYALIKEDTEVELKKKSDNQQTDAYSLVEEKTAVRVLVQDELYETTHIENASVELQDSSGKVIDRGTTDDKGMIRFTNLNKDMTYQVSQISTSEGYQLPKTTLEFSVDKDGYVDGEVESNLSITNRLIRVSIGITDKIFKNKVSDINVVLMDEEDTVIKTWNSSGVEQLITGLTPGIYQIMINGRSDSTQQIVVQNEAELQSFFFPIITVFDIGIVFSMIVVIILIIVVMYFLYLRNKEKKLEAEE